MGERNGVDVMTRAEKLQECLEWFWLFMDADEVINLHFDGGYNGEPWRKLTDDGFDEADCTVAEAWKRFETSANELRDGSRSGISGF